MSTKSRQRQMDRQTVTLLVTASLQINAPKVLDEKMFITLCGELKCSRDLGRMTNDEEGQTGFALQLSAQNLQYIIPLEVARWNVYSWSSHLGRQLPWKQEKATKGKGTLY